MNDDVVTGSVPFPDVQIVFLDQDWPDYHYPEHMERKFPTADAFVSWQCFMAAPGLEDDALGAALLAVLRHHDALRTRLAKVEGRWRQTFAPPDDKPPLVSADLSALGRDEQERAVHEAFDAGLTSLSLHDGPVMSCVHLRRGANRPGLVLLFTNHIIVDWYSSQILAADLDSALSQAMLGQRIVLPPKTTSVKAWGERVQSVIGSGEWADDLRRLTAYKRSWPPVPPGGLPLDYAEENTDEPAADEVTVTLDAAVTEVLVRQALSIWHARFLDLLQTALARAIAPWAGIAALPMCVVMHGRDPIFDDVDLTRTVGAYAMGLLDVVRPDADPSLSPLADPRLRFAQVLMNFSRPLEMTYESDGRAPYVSVYDRYNPQVTVNFQGRLGQPGNLRTLTPFQADEWLDTRIRAVSTSLDCLLAIDAGALRATWKYSPRFYHRATIARLADTFIAELTALRKDP
ncbi:hypothetical protein J5X84_02570 [Streptosporangiaceae bacterium NEAU-GS5]|nr:hypothetical protein [Streptosporangiaceae bacterium NEAU-GS5]